MPAIAKVRLLKRKPLVLIGLLLVGIVLVVLELTNNTHIFHKAKPVSGTIPSTSNSGKAKAPAAKNSSQASSTETFSPDKSATATSDTNAPLVSPYGTFVSNHHPSLSSSGQEESVCTTTPGASCYIVFTNGSTKKTLESKVADSRGGVVWEWDLNQAGFTPGKWQITATATLNGDSKDTTDSLNLEVGP